MQTFTGRKFWPLDPRPEEVDIFDIAHALAMTCRYGGHTSRFYSVAEHSVLVARFAPGGQKLAALLHDAAEAYFGDVIRPLKKHIRVGPVERRLESAIADRFGLTLFDMHAPEIKLIDNRILLDERDELMTPTADEWAGLEGLDPLGADIRCWPPEIAKVKFMEEFRRCMS